MEKFRGRRTSAVTGAVFPSAEDTTAIFEVHSDGTLIEGHSAAAVKRAAAGLSRIFAVWPGKWESDVFWVDDLAPLAALYKLGTDGLPLASVTQK